MFLFRHSWSLLLYNVCCFVPSAVAKARLGTTSDLIWTMLTRYNRWMVLFVDTICYVPKIIWQIKNNLNTWLFWYWLFTSVIIRAAVLGFLVYWKIDPNSHAFSRIRQHVVYDLISRGSHLNCQKKIWRHRQQFLRFYYNK